MTAHYELDKASTIAVEARQSGLLPGVDALILGAATELAEHGADLPESTRLVLRGFMAMLQQMEISKT
ncbi:TPA: hypothetical protein QDC55_003294 [Burkholderia cenocepacia]|nr:hypothetical protein [Burkholderia cenocepacia]HDR9810214.1 hypothetical protein [Burkholderia cenocepacia]HDR9817984.1 hypothetical protein [Burkholderia cenocepacia]HDR9829729.1 hypothetical protein [Burkholderia cenocepacia]